MTANAESERFRDGAIKYDAYLRTPEGQLRLDLALANLLEFLPEATQSLRVLDVGGGTGAMAMRLTRLGLHVTLLDSSQAMLDFAQRSSREAEVAERLSVREGDAGELANLFQAGSFDVVLCHNILEYVDDPGAVLCGAAPMLRNSSAILSVMVRNRAGEVMKAAIRGGDLVAAENAVAAEWGEEALYGGKVRLFSAESLQAILTEASLTMIAARGVRVVSDYLPPQLSRSTEYEKIFELERKLGRRPEFAAVARYIHCLARRADRSADRSKDNGA
jgi:S-adenosylmethionine-dependent methyltransferase